jgi:hypothetical protein
MKEEEKEFTEGEEASVLEGFGKPKITDVPFVEKEIKEEVKAAPKAEEAERYKEILLDLGFHKKQNGDDKEQYMYKEGNIVIGRTFSEKLPTGKFWALENNSFLDAEEVKELKIVRAFYAVRNGNKTIEEIVKEIGEKEAAKPEVPFTRGEIAHEELVPFQKGEVVTKTPNAVIRDSQEMATALYHVVEKQHLYQNIQGKKYLQLEAWQLLGKFCNVHGTTHSVEAVEYFGVTGFEARAVVRDSAGVKIGDAEAVCMRDEPNWEDKPLFQLKSMSQTRALSKAYRSCLSFIVSIAGYAPTPLEEMQGV